MSKLVEKEPECRYGHECTSGCQNDFDCPCQADHCCAMSENCDGDCDDCFRKYDLHPIFKDTLAQLDLLTVRKNV